MKCEAFLALFDGGRVVMNSGGPDYQGVQSLDWPDDVFWKPDGVAASGPDCSARHSGSRIGRGCFAARCGIHRAGPANAVAIVLWQS